MELKNEYTTFELEKYLKQLNQVLRQENTTLGVGVGKDGDFYSI